jgi:hypothetical protein
LKTSKGQPGLLTMRVGNPAIEAGGPGQQLDGEAQGVGAAVEQAANGDARRWGQLPLR